MNVKEGPIPGLKIIEPDVIHDGRGIFFQSYHNREYVLAGIGARFVQDNEAWSSAGVLRGLHYQTGAYAQAKLMRVVKGAIYDVAVDIRPGSSHRGEWFGIRLDEENKLQFFIPRGFAHGYLSLVDGTIVNYKCDNFYNKPSEGGIRYDDSTLGIDWHAHYRRRISLSDKDRALPQFGHHKSI